MQNLGLGFLELLVSHRAVASTEVNCARQYLADAAAAAYGLIVDFNVGMKLVVLAEPFGIHRVGKGRPGSVQCGLREGGERQGQTQNRDAAYHARMPPGYDLQ